MGRHTEENRRKVMRHSCYAVGMKRVDSEATWQFKKIGVDTGHDETCRQDAPEVLQQGGRLMD